MNVMTLGGIAVAVGELVDDAIVDVKIFFTDCVSGCMEVKRKSRKCRLVGVKRVRNSIVYATILVAVVFLPYSLCRY